MYRSSAVTGMPLASAGSSVPGPWSAVAGPRV